MYRCLLVSCNTKKSNQLSQHCANDANRVAQGKAFETFTDGKFDVLDNGSDTWGEKLYVLGKRLYRLVLNVRAKIVSVPWLDVLLIPTSVVVGVLLSKCISFVYLFEDIFSEDFRHFNKHSWISLWYWSFIFPVWLFLREALKPRKGINMER